MEIKNLSNTNFNGLHVTKQAAEVIQNIYRKELNKADLKYNEKLAVKQAKHAPKRKRKHFHDEQLFQNCFSNAWNKLDATDEVMLNYSLSNTKDLTLRKKGASIIADTFSINNGVKTKTNSTTLHNEHEFFGYFYKEFFKNLKGKR